MIEYYGIPTKAKNITNQQILTINQQYQLKDAIHNKKINKIKVLSIKNSNINDNAIGLLWTISQQLPIIQINLSQNFSFITDIAVDHLCQCSNMKELLILNLSDNSITNQGILKLSKASNMMKIEQLILYGNSDISSQALIYLAESEYIKNLKKLDIHDTSVDDKGLGYFLKSQNSQNLLFLDISMNSKNVTNVTLKALANSNYAKNIKQLKMEDCLITDDGITILAESENSSLLQTLNMNNSINKKNNIITNETLQAIAFSKYMKKIKVLELRNTEITSKGINTLSVTLGVQNLQILRLSYCTGIKDDAERFLQSIIEYRSLLKLYINSTLISKQLAEKLSNKYPNLSVIY